MVSGRWSNQSDAMSTLDEPGDAPLVSHRNSWFTSGGMGSLPMAARIWVPLTGETIGEAETRAARREAERKVKLFMMK